MTRADFEDAVRDGSDLVPEESAAQMDNVVVLVEDDAPDDDPESLGLYEGVPLTERDHMWAAGASPDRITIFRNPTLAICETREDVVEEVAVTVPGRSGPADRYDRRVTTSAASDPRHDGAHDHEAVARSLHALAEPRRLAIVHSLTGSERRVVDLTRELGSAQSTVSEHLTTSREVGVVAVRREGRSSWYRLVRPEVAHLLADAEHVALAP
ncbi:hypothetical protein OY671_000200 [Metschnikowia pulcherrima]|nr:hypothetical protein OY671_000200 [Metschnikowia pulcherrima]